MRLHLPSSLRHALLSALLVTPLLCPAAKASVQHQNISIKTYTDFGQNKGRYSVGNTNALLQHIRDEEGGVRITYTGEQADYTMPHGMIDFGSTAQNGASAAIGYNFIATVNHNDVQAPSFTSNELGSNAIRYQGIEYRNSSEFLHKPSNDYKITRLSKIVTDVDGSTVYGSQDGDYSGITDGTLAGQHLYRAGAGSMYRAEPNGVITPLVGAYAYITGGITNIASVGSHAADGAFSTFNYYDFSPYGVNDSTPLTYQGRGGDSGSPAWVWNTNTQQYEYLNALQSGNDVTMTQNRGNCSWTAEVMASYNKTVTVGTGETIYLGAINLQGETLSDTAGKQTTLYSGAVTDAQGTQLQRYNGIRSDLNTWSDLSGLKDTANWYNYGSGYLSSNVSYADMFHNDNLVLTAAGNGSHGVQLNATVDLGIGYVQFSRADGVEAAEFTISSGGSGDYLLNTAGFVVDEGVSVRMQLTNPAAYMREWRKVGAGDLYIEGRGNNDIFLNVGGEGRTILTREGGYAAYNVLANNSSTVQIADIGQIARDFTFGNRGGVLDMNGNSMVWNNDNKAEAAGFTIHALDEQAIITNTHANTVSLEWTQGGNQTWLGSFADSETGALRFTYNGGSGSRLDMHSIHTNLSNQAASGITVQSGTLALSGTNTEHGIGSLTGTNRTRYFSEDDWHYADAATHVQVQNDATFELGSHARLTGNVSVAGGGTYIMREGVKHRYEFIEGGYEKEDTDTIRAFFGHKGNTHLEDGATMRAEFSEGTDSRLVYDGNISGKGSMSVDAKDGILQLGGTNSFSGTKEIISGGVYATGSEALGDTSGNKWLIGEKGWLASEGFLSPADITDAVDSRSTGVLALTGDMQEEISLNNHGGLIIGAAEGKEVHYGTADKELTATNNRWTLGGGGGNLIVDFKLAGQNDLVLGNEYGKGNVHLSNSANSFSGEVLFRGGVTLTYADGAMGNATIGLSYGNRAIITPSDFAKVKEDASGTVLVDRMPTTDMDLSARRQLTLGTAADSTYSGGIRLAEGAVYRFGGSTGKLTVESSLEAGRDMLIDGQGYSGGSVVFTKAQSFNGHVTIMGYDSARGATAGDATLSFASDNAMSNASGFTVKAGGIIDLAGTNQQLSGLTLAGGTIRDSSEEKTSTLTLAGSGSLGSGVVDVAHVVKTGNGTLELGNSSTFADFSIEGGTLKLTANAKGSFRVGEGTTFDLNRQDTSGSISLGNGARLANMSTLSAALNVQEGSALASGDKFQLNGAIAVAEGATLSVQGTALTSKAALSGAGELNIAVSSNATSSVASFEGNNSAFTGTLSIIGQGSSGVYFSSAAALGKGTVSLNKVRFEVGENTSSAETSSEASLHIGSGNATFKGISTNYHFKGLSGNGTLYLDQCNDAVTRFSGSMTGFSGTLDSAASYTTDAHGVSFGDKEANYHTITGNNSAEAAELFSEGARLKSTKGTVSYGFCYTDKVVLNATVEDKANVTQSGTGTLILSKDNSSTGTLTINSGGTVQLGSGAAAGSWSGSLAGSGTLINRNYSADGVAFSSAAGFSGSLELMAGSKLSLGSSSFSLGKEQHLSVLDNAEGTTAAPATLAVSNLELNGGSLSFSGKAMQQNDDGLLELGEGGTLTKGSNLKEAVSISIQDSSHLGAQQYKLIKGDCSSFNAADFSVSGLEACFSATFSTTGGDGLVMELKEAAGYRVWAGSEGSNSWSSGFSTAPTVRDTVWFNDSAGSKEVAISGSQLAGSLVFNATEEYTLRSQGEGGLSANSIELKNSGRVVLESGISISGSATIAAGSELVVKDFELLNGTVAGAGTLTIDAGETSGSETLGRLGTLRLASGTYLASGNVGATTIEAAGGQLSLTTQSGSDVAFSSSLVLEGNALSVQNTGTGRASLQGGITLTDDATVATTGSATLLSSKLSGNNHSITKTGDGILWLATSANGGFSAEDVSFVVKEGELRLGGTIGREIPGGITSIELQNGTTLGFCASGSELTSELILEGGSTVHLSNGAGDTSFSYTFSGGMELTGSGMVTLTSAQNRNLTISGAVSGEGGLAITGAPALQLTLSNDNSFKGGIKADGNNVTINLTKAGAAGTGEISLGRANTRLNVTGNSDGSYGTMHNAISGSGSVVVGSGKLEMAGATTYTGSTNVKEGATLRLTSAATGSSNYVVENDARLELAGNGTLTIKEAISMCSASSPRSRAVETEGTLENVSVTETAITGGGNLGRIRNAAISIDAAEYTMSALELTDSKVELEPTATQLSLNEVLLDNNSSFHSSGNAELVLQNVTLTVDVADMELLQSSDFGTAFNGRSVGGISLSNFSQVALTGNLLLDATSVSGGSGYDYIAVNFGSGTNISNLIATANFGDGLHNLSGIANAGNPSVLLFATSAQAVPEPTGSALTLLGLGVLALRRRRK